MMWHGCREHNGGYRVPELRSVASGIALTSWILGPAELFSAVLALTAGLWVYVLSAKVKLTSPALAFNKLLCLLFLAVMFYGYI